MTNKHTAIVAVLFSLLAATGRCLGHLQTLRVLPAADHLQERSASLRSGTRRRTPRRPAHDLLDMTFLGEWGKQEFRRPDRWAALQKISRADGRRELRGAMELFKQYTLNKLRHVDDYGLSRTRFDPYSG